MSFSTFEYFILILVLVIISAGFVTLYVKQTRGSGKAKNSQNNTTLSGTRELLVVQAYERMVTFVSRSSLTAMMERMTASEMNAVQLADIYISTLQAEFEHNLSQQIYLPENTWQAIVDMKDQQIFILRQLKSSLPENASAAMLPIVIQTFLSADPNASMQPMILEMLKNEARKNLTTNPNT